MQLVKGRCSLEDTGYAWVVDKKSYTLLHWKWWV